MTDDMMGLRALMEKSPDAHRINSSGIPTHKIGDEIGATPTGLRRWRSRCRR